ncbi:MAG: aspartate--tRNA ligase [Leuconostoc pseudomesenteroides]|uniref:aspartate--tRNA ligase n=1 Tax=Leuconostoc pseudomesenteroides TaxID=33968 RepID=UPI0039EB85A8
MKRTTYAGLIDESYLDQTVTLSGWVQKRRDFGDLIFVDLRDREGIVQLTFNATNQSALTVAEDMRSEYVVAVTGKVIKRDESQINDKIKSGAVEVDVTSAKILATSKTPPFYIEDNVNANEELKLQYRYLDLRRPEMQKNLRVRSKIMSSAMHFMDTHDFINIETPILAKSTPEGARDYLVPSRVFPGSFYALPQSPQLFKQLLMGAGFDRYFQIARAFRDEDLRGDRQPEFTQMDVETSFMTADEIRALVNEWVKAMMHDVVNFDLDTTTIPTLTWQESMDRFGTDKPDLRIAYEIHDLSDIVSNSEFGVFANAVKAGGVVKAIAVPGGADHYSRKDIDKLAQYIERFGAKGLAWLKVTDDGLTGPIAKFFKPEDSQALIAGVGGQTGDLLLFGAGRNDVVSATLDYLRRQTAADLDLVDKTNPWAFAWIVDWPLFEYSEDFDRWIAAHHPFTMPNEEDLHYLDDGEDPHKAHAQSYDLVLNGYELGSGSIRIHRMDIQEKMLKALGFTPEKAHEAFGFLLEGMEYGFPPMGGIALGLDRLAMLLAGQENIREVIAFPKNSRATEPMTEAPTRVETKQLNELGLFVPEAE